MEDFPQWFFSGLTVLLLTIIGWMIARYVNRQDAKNERFFELLDKNEQAVTKLNTTLEFKDKMCDERHAIINRRLDKLERTK